MYSGSSESNLGCERSERTSYPYSQRVNQRDFLTIATLYEKNSGTITWSIFDTG